MCHYMLRCRISVFLLIAFNITGEGVVGEGDDCCSRPAVLFILGLYWMH